MIAETTPADPTDIAPFTLRARWVLPVAAPPIADGTVQIARGEIVGVGRSTAAGKLVDLGNVALLPGLVNAHTHLEFSDLDKPLGRAGMRFPDWIHEVIQFRQTRDGRQENAMLYKQEVVRCGADECVRSGTTLLGEIATAPIPTAIPSAARIQCTLFHEVIGLSPDRATAAIEDLTRWLETMRSKDHCGRPAISPHAPYSVSQHLLDQTIQFSRDRQIPLAMHLAESVEELELLASHSGSLVELLSRLGFWEPSAVARGQRPRDFLERLAKAHRALVIHGNFLTSDEIALLSTHRDHMSVVYCPRTHHYFGHGNYPLVELLNQDVQVALGTDSRASNPDISVWKEMQFVREHYANVSPENILRMGTLAGATAMGVDDRAGVLAAGKQADLCVIALPEESADVHEMLFDDRSVVKATIQQGRPVFDALGINGLLVGKGI